MKHYKTGELKMKNLMVIDNPEPFDITIGDQWFDEAPLKNWLYPIEMAVMTADSLQFDNPKVADQLYDYKKHLRRNMYGETPKWFAVNGDKVVFLTKRDVTNEDGKKTYLSGKPIPANLMRWAKIVGDAWEHREEEPRRRSSTPEFTEAQILEMLAERKLAASA